MIDRRAYEWDRHCESRQLPDGELEWCALTWTIEDGGARLDADDIGWAEFLNFEVLQLEWKHQRVIYGAMAALEKAPVVGAIPQSLVSLVEIILGDDAIYRYAEEQL